MKGRDKGHRLPAKPRAVHTTTQTLSEVRPWWRSKLREGKMGGRHRVLLVKAPDRHHLVLHFQARVEPLDRESA